MMFEEAIEVVGRRNGFLEHCLLVVVRATQI